MSVMIVFSQQNEKTQMQLAAQLAAALTPLADPARAAPMRAYMKDHFPFLGIPAPARRAATNALIRGARGIGRDDLLGTAHALWRMPAREYQYAALDLLERHNKLLHANDVEALVGLARDKSWWDTVDAIATLAGTVLRAARATQPDCQRLMDLAIDDADMWVRRIAMLHQLGWRGDTDTARLFAYALRLAPDNDFFIRKAIGWALREHAHHDPGTVRRFLQEHRQTLSPLTLREAARHLGPP